MSTLFPLRRAALPLGLALLVSTAAAFAQDGAPAPRPTPPVPVTPATPVTSSVPVAISGAATPVAAGGGASATGVATPAPRPRANFSGTWRLDPRASDDPAKINDMPGGRGPGGPGGGMGGRGGRQRGPALDPNQGTMPGEGFDGADRPEKERQESEGRKAGREFGSLEIFHDGDEFDLTDGMQISRVLKVGGQPTEVFTPRGSMKAAAAWEGEAMVVTERNPDGRPMRTRQFMLSADKQVLTVREVRHLPGKDGDVTMTLVYRREQPGGRPDEPLGEGDGRGGKRGR